MRKVVKGDTIIFYDVELKATEADDHECLLIEDPDITDEYFYVRPMQYAIKLPHQIGSLGWRTENGYFAITGRISKPSKINVVLSKMKQ